MISQGFWTLKKLLLTFILLLFMPLLFSLLYSGYSQYNHAIDEAKRDTRNIIHLFKEEQICIIKRTKQFLGVISEIPSVRNLDYKICDQLLKILHSKNSDYSTIILADSSGDIQACAIPLDKPLNIKDRSWFKRIKKNKEFVVDNYIISRSSKKASLPFAYPVLDKDGEFKAAVGAALDLASYEKLFEKITIPKGTLILISDSNDTILFSNIKSEGVVGSHLEMKSGLTSGKEKGRFEEKDKSGLNRIYWFENVNLGEIDNKITILVGFTKKTLFEKVQKNLILNLTILIVFTVFMLSLSWVYGEHFFLNPINALIEKTAQLKKGDFTEIEVKESLTPEFSFLNSSFNSMINILAMREKERDYAFSVLKKELHEREMIEKELRDREAHLSILFDKAADAIYVSSIDGMLIKVNKAACSATGFSREELLKMSVVDLDAVIKKMSEFDSYVEKMKMGEPALINSKHRRKDGTSYHVEITMSLFSSNDKRFVIGIARDTTERRRMEKRVKQAQKMETIGNLAGGIAHDFNNLLFPILATSELLMGKFDEKSKVFRGLKNIFDAANRSSELVKQILTFSSQSKQKKVKVKFQKVLKDVLKLTRATIPSNIEIECSVDENCGNILADPTQIHQLVMNLITNAYHAIEDQESGKISVKLYELLIEDNDPLHINVKKGKYAVLNVSDTGTGIAPEVMDKIFDPYFTTKERGKGTGLGLSTVYGIVREYSGDIKVISEKGKGASFTVYIPVSDHDPETEERIDKKKLPRGNERILLVDDEKMIVQLASEILVSLGYKVRGMTSSVEALEIFKNEKDLFDLVITDMTMPKMTGDRLAAEILAIKPDMPIIICTGYSERIDRDKAYNMGIKGYILKPVTGFEIAERVRNILDEGNP